MPGRMTPEQIKSVLDQHYKWLKGEEGGARADLTGADLTGAVLRGADLTPIRDDFFAVLSFATAEVPALIAALDAGRVNGSCYTDGECGCLVGTLAIAAGADPKDAESCDAVHGLEGSPSRPAELFFAAIRKGDTPETSQHAKIARDWAQQFWDRMQSAFGPRAAPTEAAAVETA